VPDPSVVGGVVPFGHPPGQVLDGDVFLAAVEVFDPGTDLLAVGHRRDDRGEGHDRCRKHLGAQQGVHEGGLAPLELAQDDDVEPILDELLV